MPTALGPAAAIVDDPIDIATLHQRVADPGMGAVSLFLGVVRNSNVGRPVTGIDYEAYRPMAVAELERVVLEVQGAIAGSLIAAVHRVGTLGVGDVSIAIAAAHPRRAQAIEAARQVIERVDGDVALGFVVCGGNVTHDDVRAWIDRLL